MDNRVEKKLVGVLIACGVLIVGLVVGIVVAINLNNNNDNQLPEGADCSTVVGDYERKKCLAEVTENHDEDVVEASYDKMMDTALEERDYFFYADTLNDRISALIADDKCDEAMKMLDETKVSEEDFPPVELEYFYRFARDAATLCNDETKAAEFDKKDQDLLNSGQMPVFDEVEEVPPTALEGAATAGTGE